MTINPSITHEFNGEFYQLKKSDNHIRYALYGALGGAIVSGAAILLWTNPKARATVSQTIRESANELKKNVITPNNKQIILDAFNTTVDELKTGLREFLVKVLQTSPTKQI